MALSLFAAVPMTASAQGSYDVSAPSPITANGVTATVTFDQASSVDHGTTVTATVTLSGEADTGAIHHVDLTSVKAGLATSPEDIILSAGYDADANPVEETYTFTMPDTDVDDLILTHTATLSTDPSTYFYALSPDSIIYQKNSISGVSNGPTVDTTFGIMDPCMITGIFTYHWNALAGAYVGQTLSLRHSDGTVYGPWPVSASAGQGGKQDVNWFAFPNVVIKPGTYTLVDSNNATWSWAGDTDNKGICIVKGIPAGLPLDPITDLTIEDAIAPINGEAPKSTIAATDEYTGTIAWAGDPETFEPSTNYTATITLTAKDGYTFNGVAGNAFSVSTAATDDNMSDSGVIVATFVSPPNGYITDGNGIMAYRYGSSGQLDIKGFHSGSWLQTTYGDGGYLFSYILGERVNFSEVSSIQQYLNLRDQSIAIPETDLAIHLIPSFANGGKAVKLTYQITNNGTAPEIISIAGGSDVQIGSNDGAPMSRLEDGRGFMMFNGSDQFNFFGINTVGVTNVDTFWFGSLSDLNNNYFTQQTVSSVSGVDSAMSYSWNNKTIISGQTRNFSVLIGIGGAGSENPTELGVMFDSRGGSDVSPVTGLTSGDTIPAPTPPTRGGYTFGGWYTEPECTNQFNFATPITATITLYAKWTQNAPPSGGGSYTPPQYPVTDTNQGTQAGGQVKFSSGRAMAGDTVTITVIPGKGYENDAPTILDENGNPVAVMDHGDGTFRFKMPAGGVSVDTKFTKIDYFDDVNEDDWFDEASWFCAAHGLMQGTGHRQFDGNIGTNRAMLVTVLYRLGNSSDSLENIFSDVEEGKWYSEAIAWAAHNKIVEGYGNGNFGPNDTLTREQMVAVLYRYSVFMKYDASKLNDLDSFTDADAISGWALAAMKWAVGNGIVEGVGNDLVSPETGATRAQFAAIMQRFCTGFVK